MRFGCHVPEAAASVRWETSARVVCLWCVRGVYANGVVGWGWVTAQLIMPWEIHDTWVEGGSIIVLRRQNTCSQWRTDGTKFRIRRITCGICKNMYSIKLNYVWKYYKSYITKYIQILLYYYRIVPSLLFTKCSKRQHLRWYRIFSYKIRILPSPLCHLAQASGLNMRIESVKETPWSWKLNMLFI